MESADQAPPSPLDAIMKRFLDYVQSQSGGFVTGTHSRGAAAVLDVPEALVAAMFTSARTRGLIAPDFNARGRTRWVVSKQGVSFLNHQSAASSDASTPGESSDLN